VLAAGAQLTGRRGLARAAKAAALGGISISTVALINDLGRPARFVNMLRVFKVSSPMSVGSWILSLYGPAAGAAALSDFTGILPPAGAAATAGAALLGPAVTTYTAVLLCDTAVPAWHEAHREMPYLFAGSAASAAGGFGLLAAPSAEAEPARRLAIVGGAVELTAKQLLERRLGQQAEPYRSGRAGTLLRTAEILTVCGLAGAALSRRSRVLSALSGVTLLAASAVTRFGIFEAGRASARDPEYTIVPQRERRDARAAG
jgi:formate-dependent nitrite reductase membrane component NrfD